MNLQSLDPSSGIAEIANHLLSLQPFAIVVVLGGKSVFAKPNVYKVPTV